MKYLIAILFFFSAQTASSSFADDLDLADKTELKIVKVEKHVLSGILDGKEIKVRLLGLTCESKKSTKTLSKMLVGEKVVLRSDSNFLPILKDTRNRFVAYVDHEGADLGTRLVDKGICIGAGDRPHPKKAEYALK